MAVVFGTFAGSETKLQEQGTLRAIAGKSGKIALMRKNFADNTKRVAVLITNKAGQTAVVACSKQVSDALRAQKLTIAQLAELTVVSNEEGHNFIAMPATGAIQTFELDKIAKATVETEEASFLPEALVAF